jgi:hypothetical protein
MSSVVTGPGCAPDPSWRTFSSSDFCTISARSALLNFTVRANRESRSGSAKRFLPAIASAFPMWILRTARFSSVSGRGTSIS